MKVTLIAHTPDPERVVATAARLCYSDRTVEDIQKSMDGEMIEQQIEMLSNAGHQSPWEHVSFTFAIEGVSRSLLAQITRHRIASFSVRSQRYVPMTENLIDIAVVPPAIQESPIGKIHFDGAMRSANYEYQALVDELKRRYEKEGFGTAVSEKKAIEDARFVLPNAMPTSMIVTMNARELLHFFNLRCCNRAQWEIRAVADEMLKCAYSVAPRLFKDAGCSCCFGPCAEGKMSCRKPRKAEIDMIKEGAVSSEH